jgi:chromosome segregation ATPase
MQSWGFSPSSFLVCLVGWTGSALLGGCLVAPTTGELEQAASSSSNKAIAKASQAAEKAKEEYGEEIRAASRDLATLARTTSELVAVAKESPERFAAATTEKEEVQNTVRTLAHLGKSFDRAIEVADNNTAAFRAAVVGLKDDLAQEHGVLNTQRKALMEDFRQERAEILKQVDVLSAKLLDQAARKVADLIQNALGLLIVLVLVLWGLPFGAGVFVGRLMKKKN